MKKLNVTIEQRIPADEFAQIFASIGFWNEQGFRVYNGNKNKSMGSEQTHAMADSMTIEQFILDCLSVDIANVIDHNKFKSGHSGSHVWVSNATERLLLIHF